MRRVTSGERRVAGNPVTRHPPLATRLRVYFRRCRIAALLIAEGDRAGARTVLKEVEMRMKHTPAVTLKADAPMYDWAKRTLAELG